MSGRCRLLLRSGNASSPGICAGRIARCAVPLIRLGAEPAGSALREMSMAEAGLVRGKITDHDVALLRKRIGTPNPTLRFGEPTPPNHRVVNAENVYRWSFSIGDDNPLYTDPAYAKTSAWGATVAPPGFEWSMGWNRFPDVTPELFAETRSALRGVQLFHSGAERWFYRPMLEGTELWCSDWLGNVEEKPSKFAGRSVITTTDSQYWDKNEKVICDSSRWFVHAERREIKEGEPARVKYVKPEYTDEDLLKIDAAYANEYRRGGETLYFEDVTPGAVMPTMVKGPLSVTDMINCFMGTGWPNAANMPHRRRVINPDFNPHPQDAPTARLSPAATQIRTVFWTIAYDFCGAAKAEVATVDPRDAAP